MLLLKPGSTVPVERGERVYHVAVPTIADRARFLREVRVAGGRSHSRADLLGLVERGVVACLDEADPQRGAYLEIIAEARAALQMAIDAYNDTSLDADERDRLMVEGLVTTDPALADLASMVERVYLPYREAVADNLVFDEIRAAVAARLFLAGIDGGATPFKRGFNGVADEVLAAIPRSDLAAILRAVVDLIEARPDEKKDSGKSTTGAPTRNPSGDTRTRARKGRSAGPTPGTSSH